MIHKYLSPLTGDDTDTSPRSPTLCSVYTGNWGSEPGQTSDTLVVVADTTEAEHAAILEVPGVSEVV